MNFNETSGARQIEVTEFKIMKFRGRKGLARLLQNHSAKAIARATSRDIKNALRFFASKWMLAASWVVLQGLLGALRRIIAPRPIPAYNLSNLTILVHDPSEKSNWVRVDANLTARLTEWVTDNLSPDTVNFAGSLREEVPLPQDSLVFASHDWVSRLPPKRRLRRAFLEAFIARRRGLRISVAPCDLVHPRLNLIGSILVSVTGGWTLVCQNSPRQARTLMLPNPIQAQWNWPMSCFKEWGAVQTWVERQSIALVATSGDERREEFFAPLISSLRANGYQIKKTDRSLDWSDYVSMATKARIVATTCEIQPQFMLGPSYFRKRLPDGHITMRVFEGFASGTVVVTQEIQSLREFGFLPGEHYLRCPRIGESWDDFELPDSRALEQIAGRGKERFEALVAGQFSLFQGHFFGTTKEVGR